MHRIFLYLLIFFNCSFALDVTPKVVPVYKEIDILYNLKSIDEAIKFEEFKNIKRYRHIFHRNKSHNNLWIKLNLVNKSNEPLQRVFVSRWERVNFDLYAVSNKKIIFTDQITNNNYIKKSSTFTIDKNSAIDLYVHIKEDKALDQFNYIYIIDSKEAEQFILNKNILYNHGLFFGILFTMAMYSFFMFFSIKEKGYLYLGLYQVLVLVVISDLWQYFFVILADYPNLSAFLLKDMLSYSVMILSILFTQEFLNTKKQMPKFHNFLNISIVLLIPLNLFYSHVQYSIFLYSIYLWAGVYIFIKKKDFSALFFTLGFLGFTLYLIILNLSRIFSWDFYFEFIYAKQIFTCIESFALTMALYLKICSIVKEREKAKEESIKNEKMMLEQSRFATMGEMLASIAHQWRQPLNHVTMIFSNLQLASETKKLNTEYLNKKTNEANLQLKYMSDTIEDFSNFFANKGGIEKFTLEDVCKLSLDLVYSRCKKLDIQTSITSDNLKVHMNYKNELTQILVVILNNAIDALMLSNSENRVIEIEVKGNSIIISDNAGGIPENIMHKIFDPYFSTKDKKLGTGLGLYTAKTIIDTLMKGEIKVKNLNDGAAFTISIP